MDEPQQHTGLRAVELAVLAIVVGWLSFAAGRVNIEYYDGLSAIANARYFLGLSDRYVFDRAPMMAWVMMPAEWYHSRCGLHPLEVRPHHALMALLNVVYVIGAYALIVRMFGRCWAVLISFVAAVLTFMFFSYAPFISHDLVAGLMLLYMLNCAHRFADSGRKSLWFQLVIVGTAAALVKQTFGAFWLLVLLVHVFRAGTKSGDGPPQGSRIFLWLLGGAVVSGAVTWIVLGVIFENSVPGMPLLLRPLENLRYLANVYEGKNVEFPLWIYVRNFPAYGWLTTVLIVPGLILSLRGTPLQREIAVAWVGAFVFMHLLPLREVRYLAFLAPLSACVLIPAVRTVARDRTGLVLIAALFAADLYRCTAEASRIVDPFYSGRFQRQFFAVLEDKASLNKPVYVNAPMFSFVSPVPSPLAADRYHRIFHVGVVHMEFVFGRKNIGRLLNSHAALAAAAGSPDGAALLYCTGILARGPTWRALPPVGLDRFFQCTAVCRSDEVRLLPAGSVPIQDGGTVIFELRQHEGQSSAVISGGACASLGYGDLFPVVVFDSGKRAYHLNRLSKDSFEVLGFRGDVPPSGEHCTIRRFVIDRKFSATGASLSE